MFLRPQMDDIHNRLKAKLNVDKSVNTAHINNKAMKQKLRFAT